MILLKNNGDKTFELAWETQNYCIAPGATIGCPANVAKAIQARSKNFVVVDPPVQKRFEEPVKPTQEPIAVEPKVEPTPESKAPVIDPAPEGQAEMNPKIASINLKSRKKKA